ncbi:hypothetical protein [Neobacillus mesonae]|uniref:hypothetical protein n=1 Tax=Neobacillus mesonae TaxID=1193713 RepID=UPI0008325744|nr:hypothetical protein [Neobacillus mesonae]
MEYKEFERNISFYKQLGINIPFYYELIDDNAILTPNEISAIFNRNVDRVRQWFNPGLKHGALPSFDPTRHKCTGLDLKEWLFKKDIKKFMKNKKFKELV